MAEQVADNPSGSFPIQTETWSDLKAAYRLFDSEVVTFEAIAEPHWQRTRKQTPGRYLLLDDTTELDFGINREIENLGPTGNGTGRGFLLHNALMVRAGSREVLGVAGQAIHYRKPVPKKESRSSRRKRQRESEVWGRVIDLIGRPGEGSEFIHVCDRGADNFEVYCHLRENECGWVIRVSSLHRKILTLDGESTSLSEYLSSLPVSGSYELQMRRRKTQPARKATLQVRFGKIRMPAPAHKSSSIQAKKPQPIEMNVVWVREVNHPKGATPIEWVLYTSLDVDSFEDAWCVIEYYETRWLVEEYHKALKSGCRVTQRGLQEAHRLEPMVALMSVVGVRLLQLKSMARSQPKRPARQIVPRLWLTMLKAARKNLRRVYDLTVYEFYRELAKLGGFLGRKSDGEPGWITIWRGWEKLNAIVRGAELLNQLKKCG